MMWRYCETNASDISAYVPHAGQGSWKAFLYLHSPCLSIDNLTNSMVPKPTNDFILSFKKISPLKFVISKMRFRSICKPSACPCFCLHITDVLLFHWSLSRFYFGLELFSQLSPPHTLHFFCKRSLALPPTMKSRMSTCLYGYFCSSYFVVNGNLQKRDCLRWMIIYSSFSLTQIESIWEECSWGITMILNT